MDAIAAPFDASRDRPWAPVEEFLATLPAGQVVLDAGGGNGRHALAAVALGHRAVVLDASARLVRRARGRAREAGLAVAAVEGDLVRLPVADAAFDHAMAVAALHCVPGRTRRRAALAELARVVRPGGAVFVTVWARDQPRFRDLLAAQRQRLAGTGGQAGVDEEPGDVVVPWRHGLDRPVERYFHLYTLEELVADLGAAGLQVQATAAVALGGAALDNLVAIARVPPAT